jgi:hypothetical protein
MLTLVVLRNIAVGNAATLLGIGKPHLTHRMIEVLDRLAEHFTVHQRGAA